MVVAEICDLCTSTEVAPRSYNGISNIIEMRDFCPAHDNRVLEFGAMPDMTIISDTGCPANICMGTDAAVFPYNTGPLNVCTGFDHGALSNDYAVLKCHAPLDFSIVIR